MGLKGEPGKQVLILGFLSSLDEYTYHHFTAGSFGCDAADGPFAVLWVGGMETQSSPVAKVGPCTGNTQTVEEDYEYAIWLWER